METELTLIVEFPGERSTGIPSATWEIDNISVEDDEHREQIRKAFKEAFDCQTGGGHRILFSDEISVRPDHLSQALNEGDGTYKP